MSFVLVTVTIFPALENNRSLDTRVAEMPRYCPVVSANIGSRLPPDYHFEYPNFINYQNADSILKKFLDPNPKFRVLVHP